jgi:hypothetical protein
MGGLDTLIFGFLLTPSAKFDSMFSDILRNHLFEAEKLDRPGRLYKSIDLIINFYFSTNETF